MTNIISIPVKELNEVCARKDRKFSTETYFKLFNRECVDEVFRYKKFQDDFADTILCVHSGQKGFLNSFKPSYDEFLKSIIKALNLDIKDYKDDEELTKLLNERLELLRTLPDEAWLYNNFPVIYRNLQDGRKYLKKVEQDEKNGQYPEVSKEEKNYYYSCAMKRGFNDFMKCQVESYRRFIEQRGQYKSLIESKNYNKFIQENYDIDKLAMYIAHKYLVICEENINNRAITSRYIKLLNKYIDSSFDKTVYITINHQTIDYRNIIERMKNISGRLKKVDGMVNWALAPQGRRAKYVPAGKDPHRNIPMTLEELDNLRMAGEAKDKFYLDHQPIIQVYGTLRYDGYIAYIYKNGKVVLDTYYDPEYPTRAKDNAIYYMDAKYFEMVSGLDKQKLRKHSQVHCKYHAGAWQERMSKIITKEGSPEEQEQAKALVKRINEINKKNS